MASKSMTAIGLMSGTSLDGLDAAIIHSDGEGVVKVGAHLTRPYTDDLRDRLKALIGATQPSEESREVERAYTLENAALVADLMVDFGVEAEEVAVIGFHGQTLFHNPAERFTWQLGDPALLASATGISVVGDFRHADVAAGGEGAPFAPAYHRALLLSGNVPGPVAVLNIGGVANVTWVGEAGDMLAFDTGPGNTLMDLWAERHLGTRFDEDGALAASGTAKADLVARFLAHPYFGRPAPKSLDRTDFFTLIDSLTEGLSPAEGAATLMGFTVESIAESAKTFPSPVTSWRVTGGGRHNGALMAALGERLGVAVAPVESLGWNGDGLEAECFAFLAIRSLQGAPLSYPTTTGVAQPMPGGKLYEAKLSCGVSG